MEKLAEMGVVLRPAGSLSEKAKGKLRAVPAGHVIFVERREDCKVSRRDLLLIE